MREQSLKTDAFIIKTQDFGESDRIITLFTREFGKLKSIAKGAKNSKKRFLNCLEPFCLIDTILAQKKEDANFYRMDGAKLILDYPNLQKQLSHIKKASFLMELINHWTAESDPHPELFNAIKWIMGIINNEKAQLRHIIFFNIILLKLTGILPRWDNCKICGVKLTAGAWCENIHDGVFSCKACKDNLSSFYLSSGTLKTFNFILNEDLERINLLHLNKAVLEEAFTYLKLFNQSYMQKSGLYDNHLF